MAVQKSKKSISKKCYKLNFKKFNKNIKNKITYNNNNVLYKNIKQVKNLFI